MFKKILVSVFIVLFMFCGSVSADLNDGLVLHYEFENNFNDSSSNGFNGTEYGGVEFVEGVRGQAVSFDGIDDYIDVGVSLGGYSAFSLFTWVNFLPNPNRSSIITAGWVVTESLGSDGGFGLSLHESLRHRSTIHQQKIDYTFIYGPYSNPDEWYFVGFTWDGTTHKFYINGDEISSEQYTGIMGHSAKNTIIGAKYYTYAPLLSYFNGMIDDLWIHNRAITDDEIQQLYTGIFPPTLEDRIIELETQVDDLEEFVNNLETQVNNLETVINELQFTFGNHTHIYKTGPSNEHSQIDVETSIPQ